MASGPHLHSFFSLERKMSIHILPGSGSHDPKIHYCFCCPWPKRHAIRCMSTGFLLGALQASSPTVETSASELHPIQLKPWAHFVKAGYWPHHYMIPLVPLCASIHFAHATKLLSFLHSTTLKKETISAIRIEILHWLDIRTMGFQIPVLSLVFFFSSFG